MVDINPVIAWSEEDPYFIDPTFQNTRKQRHAQLRSDYEASNPAFQNTRKQNHAQLREASI